MALEFKDIIVLENTENLPIGKLGALVYFKNSIKNEIKYHDGNDWLSITPTILTELEYSNIVSNNTAKLGILYYRSSNNKFYKSDNSNSLVQIGDINVKSDWNSNTGDSEILNKPSDLTDLSIHDISELRDVSTDNALGVQNLSGVNTGDESQSSESIDGIIKIATQTNVDDGVDDSKAITSLKLKNRSFGTFNGNILNDNSTDKSLFQQIENYLENLKIPISWNWTGSRNSNNSSDRDMQVGTTPTNSTKLIVPVNCVLKYITASSRSNETWEAHIYRNGSSVVSLNINNTSKLTSNELNVTFNVGDEIRLRQQNSVGAINRPRISVFFQEIV